MGDDEAELSRLLDARNEHPESLAEIDGEIWRRFGHTRAVLVLDMCGLSSILPPKKRASEMNDEHSNPQAWAAGGGGARRPTLSFGFHPAARFN